MIETKVNLIIALPGRTMLSEQECLRKVRKPLIGKGKKEGQILKDKNGNEIWISEKEYNPSKCERFVVYVKDKGNLEKPLSVFVRGTKQAIKIMNLNKATYRYFISDEMPEAFKVPKDLREKEKNISNKMFWVKRMSEEDRLKWHLNYLSSAMGGTLLEYTVFKD